MNKMDTYEESIDAPADAFVPSDASKQLPEKQFYFIKESHYLSYSPLFCSMCHALTGALVRGTCPGIFLTPGIWLIFCAPLAIPV